MRQERSLSSLGSNQKGLPGVGEVRDHGGTVKSGRAENGREKSMSKDMEA